MGDKLLIRAAAGTRRTLTGYRPLAMIGKGCSEHYNIRAEAAFIVAWTLPSSACRQPVTVRWSDTINRPRTTLCITATATVALLFSGVVKAQPTPRNTTVNVNYVYAASLGFGGYSIGGLSASVYTLPLSKTLKDLAIDGWPGDGWAIKLLLPIQLGLYDFHATVDGQELSVSQQSLTVVPGAELQIPVTYRFVVKPFAQAGPGHSFGTGSTNPNAWVYLTGVRSVAQWQSGDYTFSLGNGVIYAGDNAMGPGFSEHYVALQVAGEVRRPLGFRIGGFAPDVGVFAAEYYYPAPLQFSRFLHDPLQISNQNEIGFSVGSAEPSKLLWLSNPRIGAGIVFGGGLTVYHINFGFPF